MPTSNSSTGSSPFKSARLGLWLPEPTDSLTQTLCKVYGIGSTDPMLQGLVELHLNLNRDVFSQYAPLEKKVIYLADLHANKGTRLDTSKFATTQALLNSQKAELAGSKQALEAIVPSNPVEVEAMRFALGFNEVMGHVGTGVGIGVSTVSTLTGRHLQTDILEFNRWANEKANLVKNSKSADILHHYDARADEISKHIKNRLGPTERFLFKNGTKDALFNGVSKSLRPTALTCHKLSNTREEQKVETAYKEVGGIFGGLLVGASIGLAVVAMATPVGWVGAVVIGSVSAYGGRAIGEAVGNVVHTSSGDVFSLKDGKILNNWCR